MPNSKKRNKSKKKSNLTGFSKVAKTGFKDTWGLIRVYILCIWTDKIFF